MDPQEIEGEFTARLAGQREIVADMLDQMGSLLSSNLTDQSQQVAALRRQAQSVLKAQIAGQREVAGEVVSTALGSLEDRLNAQDAIVSTLTDQLSGLSTQSTGQTFGTRPDIPEQCNPVPLVPLEPSMWSVWQLQGTQWVPVASLPDEISARQVAAEHAARYPGCLFQVGVPGVSLNLGSTNGNVVFPVEETGNALPEISVTSNFGWPLPEGYTQCSWTVEYQAINTGDWVATAVLNTLQAASEWAQQIAANPDRGSNIGALRVYVNAVRPGETCNGTVRSGQQETPQTQTETGTVFGAAGTTGMDSGAVGTIPPYQTPQIQDAAVPSVQQMTQTPGCPEICPWPVDLDTPQALLYGNWPQNYKNNVLRRVGLNNLQQYATGREFTAAMESFILNDGADKDFPPVGDDGRGHSLRGEGIAND